MNIFGFVKGKSGKHRVKTRESISSSLFLESHHAVVSDAITSHCLGRIYYQNTYWFACALNDVYIPEGVIVEVLERRANTWLVRPVVRSSYSSFSTADLN